MQTAFGDPDLRGKIHRDTEFDRFLANVEKLDTSCLFKLVYDWE